MKVAVIGAGITGITTAYSLAKRGVKVTVIDREYYPGMKTSYANGGQLSVSNSDVWTTWSNVSKGLKWMTQKDAPLLVRPLPTYSKIKWLTKFLYNTWKGDSEANTIETIRIGKAARDVYLQISDEEGIDFDLTKKGILHFYRDKTYYENAKSSLDMYQNNGIERFDVDPDMISKIEPTINMKGIVGGIFTPSDMNGDIHKFCVELMDVLRSKYDVDFIYGYEADFLPFYSITYDHVVVCAGVESPYLASQINETLDIYPVKGYSITIDVGNSRDCPSVSLLDDEKKIVSSRLGNRFRVAGTAELDGHNYDIRNDRIIPLKRWVNNNFCGIHTEHVVPWVGLRPMTPNMLPIARQSKTVRNVWYNTGHGHLGWTMGAATAEVIADNIFIDSNKK
jgi:D-amino-acid dehydrogenase